MAAQRKPSDRRQGRGTNDVGVLSAAPQVAIPTPPAGLLTATTDRWKEFWASPMAEAVNLAADRSALERLFWLYDERERASIGYRQQRMVEGSMGQPVLNPLMKTIQACDAEIRQLEDRFGMTPKARINMGATVANTQLTIDQLNRSLERDLEEEDPRVAVLDQHRSAR